MSSFFPRPVLAATTAIALCLPGLGQAAPARNIIMMISDGASWGTWDMASYWEHGAKGRQVYDDFDVRLGMTTYPLNTSSVPTGGDTPTIGYDPAQAWDSTPTGQDSFAGYDYLKRDVTDSAAAGTALATGRLTYNNAIGVDNNGQVLKNISEAFKEAGRSAGVVASVPFSHATPASFGAHNLSRNNYGEIAREMVDSDTLDLIMGAGNPWYDDNGAKRDTPAFANETGTGGGFTPESVWDALNGDNAPMTLIQSKADFEALADGTLSIDGRLIGVPTVGSTLQYGRDDRFGADAANPTGLAYNPDVPSLATMTTGALKHLGRNANGFFAMIEGGAVDWAAHANDTARIIEEQVDFNASVRAAHEWVEQYSNWEETLLLVLTDHGNAMPMGPTSNIDPFQPIQNNGAGVLPGVMWHHGSHTNENTLLWARGAGADALNRFVVGQDQWLALTLGHNASGDYLTNTGVHAAMMEAAGLAPAPVPLPAGVVLMGSGIAAFAALRRRKSAAA